MTWASFVDFWLMREMGLEDTVFRNYNVMALTGKGDIHLWAAIRRAGFQASTAEDALNTIPTVIARLAALGVQRPTYEQVRVRLIGWYTWDRIRKGEVQSWMLSEYAKNNRRAASP
jgi:hypothetical protein